MKNIPTADLTPRELEVALLLAEGNTDSQVAEKLIISWDTVRTHHKNIFSKLKVKCKAAMIRELYLRGKIDWGTSSSQ